jgi:hypothetical protein
MGAWVSLGRPGRERCPQQATTSRPSTAPVSTATQPVLSAVERAEGAERHARERAIGIFSQMWAPWCSRAPSAMSRTTIPTGSSRSTALSRLLSSAETEAALSIVDKLMK